MAIVEVKVPQLSESVAEATLLQWKKKAGEAVARDEILIEIETDKVVLEVPAPAAGVLAEIVEADGGTVAAERGHRADRHRRQGRRRAPRQPAAAAAAAAAAAPAAAAPQPAARKADVAMPAAAKMMADNSLTAGSRRRHRQGRPRHQGRRARRAVAGGAKPVSRARAAAPAGAPSAALPQVAAPVARRTWASVPSSACRCRRLRARIAERLLQSQSTNAILTTFNEVNMAPVMELRKRYQEQFEKEHGVKLGFMSLLRQGGGARAEEVPGDQRLGRRQRHRLPRLLRHRHRGRLAARPGGADPAQRRPDELRRHREEDRRVRQARRRTASWRSKS